MSAVAPNTKVASVTTQPRIAPITSAPCRLTAARIEKESSGREVPRAITKSPIKILGIPKASAKTSPVLTRIPALPRRTAAPSAKEQSSAKRLRCERWS